MKNEKNCLIGYLFGMTKVYGLIVKKVRIKRVKSVIKK